MRGPLCGRDQDTDYTSAEEVVWPLLRRGLVVISGQWSGAVSPLSTVTLDLSVGDL